MTNLYCGAAVLAILVSLAACSKTTTTEPAPTPSPPGIFLISTDDGTFSPPQITVSHGDTIVWFNGTQNVHTVTTGACAPCVPDGAWDSDSLLTAETFLLVFAPGFDPTGTITFVDTTGTFAYYCAIHGVTGSITVTP